MYSYVCFFVFVYLCVCVVRVLLCPVLRIAPVQSVALSWCHPTDLVG